jgi:hypothetical protein
MGRYVDREGKEISVLEWRKLRREPSYRLIAQTALPDGNELITTWLGIDFGPEAGPLVFETLGAERNGGAAKQLGRYATLDQATLGHQELVGELSR